MNRAFHSEASSNIRAGNNGPHLGHSIAPGSVTPTATTASPATSHPSTTGYYFPLFGIHTAPAEILAGTLDHTDPTGLDATIDPAASAISPITQETLPGAAQSAAPVPGSGNILGGVHDMSTDGTSLSIHVTIHESLSKTRQFVIPQSLLLNKNVALSDSTLHGVSIEAFNLFVMWLHGLSLPKVAETVPAVNFRNRPDFAVTLIPGFSCDIGTPQMNTFQHICFMEVYKDFSIEEMRLELSTKYEHDNEKIQNLLLQLALLAHRFKWFDCFNNAMDLYRTGERRLQRNMPKIEHVQLAYGDEPLDRNPTMLFMADYAFYRCIESGLAQLVNSGFLNMHAFMEDFMTRLNGAILVPGCVVTWNGNGRLVQTELQSNTTEHPSTPLDDVNDDFYHMPQEY